MRRPVRSQIARRQRFAQCDGLLKRQRHAFTGDGIDGTRSLSDQRHGTPRDRIEATRHGDGAFQRG